MVRYLGPADNLTLEEGGRVYHPGDNVPISAAMAKHMSRVAQGGHRFEGVPAEDRPPRSDIAPARVEGDESKDRK